MIPSGFECEDSLRPHLEKVFDGEYDVPIENYKPLNILDIGANVGAFSLWALQRWPGSHIIAYEPHPETFLTLKKNISLVSDAVITVNFGLGNPGVVPIYDGKNNSSEATIYPGNLTAKGTGRFVEILHPLVVPNADILKIDTEGCEIDILEPLIGAGREYAAVMVEFHRISDRRIIDHILQDYVLTKSVISECPAIGTVNYIHKKFAKGWI